MMRFVPCLTFFSVTGSVIIIAKEKRAMPKVSTSSASQRTLSREFNVPEVTYNGNARWNDAKKRCDGTMEKFDGVIRC